MRVTARHIVALAMAVVCVAVGDSEAMAQYVGCVERPSFEWRAGSPAGSDDQFTIYVYLDALDEPDLQVRVRVRLGQRYFLFEQDTRYPPYLAVNLDASDVFGSAPLVVTISPYNERGVSSSSAEEGSSTAAFGGVTVSGRVEIPTANDDASAGPTPPPRWTAPERACVVARDEPALALWSDDPNESRTRRDRPPSTTRLARQMSLALRSSDTQRAVADRGEARQEVDRVRDEQDDESAPSAGRGRADRRRAR